MLPIFINEVLSFSLYSINEMIRLIMLLKIKNITLASLTHFTRHRMHSHIIPNLDTIINQNKFKIAPTIKANAECETLYKNAVNNTSKVIEKLQHLGAPTLSYLYAS